MNTATQTVETAKAASKKAKLLAAAKGTWTKSQLSAFGVSL